MCYCADLKMQVVKPPASAAAGSKKSLLRFYCEIFSSHINFELATIHNTIKVPQWYDVQGSDTTMFTIAASLPGQKNLHFTDCRLFIAYCPLLIAHC